MSKILTSLIKKKIYLRVLILYLVFGTIHLSLWCQTDISDSQFHYETGDKAYEAGEFTEAITHYQSGLYAALKENEEQRASDLLNDIGLCYYLLGTYDSALVNYTRAFEIDRSSNDLKRMAGRQRNLGSTYRKKGLFEYSLTALLLARQYAAQLPDSAQLASANNSIGNLYLNQERYAEAGQKFSQVFTIAKKLGNTKRLATVTNNLGNVMYKLHFFDSAIFFYHKSLAYKGKDASINSISLTLNNIGEAWLSILNTDSAQHYIDLAYGLRKTNQDSPGMAASAISMAKLFLIKKLPELSRRYLEEAKTLAKRLNNRSLDLEILYMEIDLLEYSSDYESANVLLRKWTSLRDSIFNSERLNVQKLESDFLLNQELASKMVIQVENDVLKKTAFTRLLLMSISILLVIVVVIGIFLISKSRKKIKGHSEKIEELLKESHHRVGNNLQILTTIFSSQLKSIQDKESVELIRDAGNRLKSLNAIHRLLSINPNSSQIQLDKYLKSITQQLAKSFQSKNNVQLIFETEQLWIDADQAIQIGLVANEIITNSFKYAFEETLSPILRISLLQQDNSLWELSLSDNGQGIIIQREATPAGFGSQFIANAVKDMQAELSVFNNNGTIYRIVFKPYQKKK